MDARWWGWIGARAVVVVAAVALGAGCANEGDLQGRWVEAFGSPDGVDRLTGVDCQEPFPGTLEGCAVKVELDEEVDAEAVTAIVERYVEVAGDVYGDDADGSAQLGSLVLDDASSRRYRFSPRPSEDGAPLRTEPEPAAVASFVRSRGDDRFREVDVTDEAQPQGATMRVELASEDPPILFARIERLAVEFEDLDGVTFQSRVPGGEVDGIADVSVTAERGRVPAAEWRFALSVVAAERGRAFDVRVSPGSVHLVVVVDAANDSGGRLEDVEAIRERTVDRAPESIRVAVGSRPRRA